jgi:hypothetical protein
MLPKTVEPPRTAARVGKSRCRSAVAPADRRRQGVRGAQRQDGRERHENGQQQRECEGSQDHRLIGQVRLHEPALHVPDPRRVEASLGLDDARDDPIGPAAAWLIPGVGGGRARRRIPVHAEHLSAVRR